MNRRADRILVVDDEPNILALFERVLGKEGYEVVCASSGEQAVGLIETEWFDLVISDLKMPGIDGLELLKKTQALIPGIPFILLTAYGTVESAVAAIKEGAHDYLTKPGNNEDLRRVVGKALEMHRLTREVERLRSQLELNLDFEHIIGRSRPMRAIFRLVNQVAKTNCTVLVQGESGVGKELIARAIHRHSPRREAPFIAIDCASIPDTLLESELFGHVRGAFTGAISNKKGLFEEAYGGTLFLDEIGETTPSFQLKLLRVLQENEIRPVGSTRNISVDGRVIAATNKDLKREVEAGNFRQDLFYRLAVVPIIVPPLRERREDILSLVDHFINKYCKQNKLEAKRAPLAALKRLTEYRWPGNVRELEHLIERAVLLSPGVEIGSDLLLPIQTGRREERTAPLQVIARKAKESVERDQIIDALQKTRGKRAGAARLLGISRAALYKKLKRYELGR